MAAKDIGADQITLPIKRTDGETLEERLTSNAYNNILPARYLRKDADGNLTESQGELFERVAKNIALAEAVFEAEKRGVEVTVTPEQVKPEHPRRDELTAEVFGEGTTVSDDAETALTAENVNKFAYDTVVPELPDGVGEHVESVADEYRELMESLSFVPNSPTLMNAGDELQQLSACIAGHAPVFTRDGLKRMDEVRPGDEVLTHRGRYKEVLDHWSNGEKSTVEMRRGIERGSCFDTQLTPDHEVYTSDGRWVRADEVENPADPVFPVDEAFPETIDLTQYTARLRKQKEVVVDEGRVKLRNASDPRTPTFDQQNNQPVASVVNDDELAWLFGIYLAEGDVYGSDLRFTLGTDEAELCERLIETLERVFDTPVSVSESSHGRWTQIRLSSSFVADLFASALGTGGGEKRIPTWVGDADESYRQSLLDGLLDGDGTTLDTAYRLVMANPTLVYEATLLARSLGYDAVFKLDKERELSSRRTSECYISTAENSRLSNVARREAETIEVYDMSIADDHSFVVGDFVVHNCFVDSPEDDLTDIHQTAKEAAEVFQSGGGMGYAFWRLRPYGDPVGSTGGIASGPITFMETFDQMCETIAQGGTRRGAQMGVMRVSHPDVIEFIHSKNKDVSLAHCLRLNDPDDYTYTTFAEALEEARGLIDEDGRVPKHLRNAVEGHLSNFNISVGVTDDFMEALYEGEEFTFTNPRTDEPHVATRETKEMYERYGLGEYVEPGEEFSIPAGVIWDRIVDGAYENGEPGVIYLERVNKQHSFDVEKYPDHQILATNPCGEQPLEEYEACNLGHINLSTLAALDAPDWRVWSEAHADEYDSEEAAVEAFLEEAMDWEAFDHRIEWGTRFLENVVTMSDFPVPEIEEKVREMRKIGLGVMGLAQLYVQLGVRYGSDAGNEMARQLMQHINHGSKWASHELAEERGSFEEWGESKYADPLEYREWFEHHTGLDAEEWAEGFPIRNHNTTTIAPTGTTSMVGNTTGGCEPIYNVAYYKNVSDDVQGDEMLVEFDDYFLRTLEANDIDVEAVKREAQEQMANNEFDGVEGLETVPDAIGELFVVTSDLSGKEHAAVQCALQGGVDSAISKTCNFPNSASKEDMDEVYRYIYDHGGKGVTVYRDGTRSKQVLTTRADNAEYAGMDEEEAAAAILENIDQAFGDIERFLDHEAVEERLGDAIDLLASGDGSAGADEAADIEYAEKQPRPDVLRGVTQRIDTGYGKVYITINEDAETGRPFELFANTGMSGGFTASFTEALAKSISVALRSGVDPSEIADKLRGIRSPKVAWDKGEQINSIPDAFGVALRRYLDDEIDRPYPRQQNLTEVGEGDDAAAGSSVEPEPEAEPETDGGGVGAETPAAAGASEDATQSLIDAGESPECPDCGSMSLYFSEGCKTCQACGWSEC